MSDITVSLTFEEYDRLLSAILWSQIEEEDWRERCKDGKSPRERNIYQSSVRNIQVLNKIADKLRKAYYGTDDVCSTEALNEDSFLF